MQRNEHSFYDFAGSEDGQQAETLAVLRQGASTWNSWITRYDHLRYGDKGYEPKFHGAIEARANLRHADLQGANLNGFDLRRVDLQAANLRGASLINASLVDTHAEFADFSGAACRNTDFSMAYFSATRFDQADCRWAQFAANSFSGGSLDGTDLSWASFRLMDFTGVSMHEAVLGRTSFADCDLSQVAGLETCRHQGPSWLDIATLLQSSRALTDAFLRQAGVPEIVINYLPSLLAEPLQFYTCFISYSSADSRFADRLYADLQAKGVRCWYAPDHMSIGDRIRDTIEQSIRMHETVIVVLSEESVRSDWVEAEVETALEREREANRLLAAGKRTSILFPITIDNSLDNAKRAWVRDLVRLRHIGDFSNWKDPDQYVRSLERLMRDLRTSR
jgi:uncharacterized protein YjbI with pentapeptide repeats